jgi:hypothetical protein
VPGPLDKVTARMADTTGVIVPRPSAEQLVQEAARDLRSLLLGAHPTSCSGARSHSVASLPSWLLGSISLTS